MAKNALLASQHLPTAPCVSLVGPTTSTWAPGGMAPARLHLGCTWVKEMACRAVVAGVVWGLLCQGNFGGGNFATCGNSKALAASRTLASPRCVRSHEALQIDLPVKASLIHDTWKNLPF